MRFLEIENLRKVFVGSVGVQHFDIAVERGEFISFLGPSGCGKTTTLRSFSISRNFIPDIRSNCSSGPPWRRADPARRAG